MFKRITAATFSAIMLLFCTGASTAFAKELKISVVHTSDMFGTIFRNEEKGTIGYGNVLSVKEKLGDPLVIDCGNFLSDTSQKSTGINEKIVYAMNKAGYKYATLGYNDLKYSKSEIDTLLANADFEIISSNIKLDGEYAFTETATKMIDGVKVGIFSVTDCEAIGEFQISDPEAEAQRAVQLLKSGGSKIIIALVNTQNSDFSKKLVSQNPDITMLLESGTNNFLPNGDLQGRTLIVNSGSRGNAVGVSSAILDGSSLKSFETSNYNLDNIKSVFPTTNNLEEEMGNAQSEIDSLNSDVLYTLKEAMPAGDEAAKSTALGNFTADAVRAAANADIAIVKGSSITGGLSENITGKELNELFDDNDDIAVKKIKGGNLFKLFEIALNKIVADENGNIDYEASKSDMFLQVSGLKIEYNPTYPSGKRIVKMVTDSGKKIGQYSNDEFIVAGSSELMSSYSEYASGAELLETKENMLGLMRDYLSENKSIEADFSERIKPTDAKKSYMWIVWTILASFAAAVILAYIVAIIVMFINRR